MADIVNIIEVLLQNYYRTTQYLYSKLLSSWPRFDNYNHFDKFVILNLTILASFIAYSCITSFNYKNIYLYIVKLIFSLPFVRKEVQKNLKDIGEAILANYPEENRPKLTDIPYKDPSINLGDKS